jgi:hypothetical protein
MKFLGWAPIRYIMIIMPESTVKFENIEAIILDKDGVFVDFNKVWLRIIAYRAQLIAERAANTSPELATIREACLTKVSNPNQTPELKLIEQHPELKYKNDIDGYMGGEDNFYNLFNAGIRNGIYESEDWGFCSLWKESGGQVLIHPDINLKHVGWHEYSGNLVNYIFKQ